LQVFCLVQTDDSLHEVADIGNGGESLGCDELGCSISDFVSGRDSQVEFDPAFGECLDNPGQGFSAGCGWHWSEWFFSSSLRWSSCSRCHLAAGLSRSGGSSESGVEVARGVVSPGCPAEGAVIGGGGGGREESMSMGAGPVGQGGKRAVMASCFTGFGGRTVLKSVPR
jgi:hypothetical protein